jgi:DNA polymerase-3 subunit beta
MEKKDTTITVAHDVKGKAVAVVTAPAVKEAPKAEQKPEQKKDVKKPALKVVPKKAAAPKPETEKKPAPKKVAKPESRRTSEKPAKAAKKEAKPAAQKKAATPKTDKKEEKVEIVMLRIARKEFQETLSVARSFTEPRTTMPILSHILLSANTGECTLTATDLEKSWTKKLECFGDDVTRCIPLDILYSEVKALDADIVEVELLFDEKSVKVNKRCEIFTLPAKEFPKSVAFEGKNVDITGLTEKLTKVLPAVGESDTRYTLNGVFLDLEKGMMVGTDGHRMHLEHIPTDKAGRKIIIPRRTAALMVKHEAPNALGIGKASISCTLAGGVMISSLIEGTYPTYEAVIPKENTVRLIFHGAELLKILEGAVPITSTTHNAIRMIINGRLEIETQNPDMGHYRWHLPCAIEGKKGGELLVGFNAKYLIDAIKAYTTKDNDRVEMTMNEALTPCMINAGAIVMPLRV